MFDDITSDVLKLHVASGGFLPPSRHQAVPFGIPAFVPHAALAEREFVLRVHQRRRRARMHPVDAACAQHAIADNVLYSSGLTARPTSSASSSRITRRSHTPLRQSASAMISKNGTNIVS